MGNIEVFLQLSDRLNNDCETSGDKEMVGIGPLGYSIMSNCLVDNSNKWQFVLVLWLDLREKTKCRITVDVEAIQE